MSLHLEMTDEEFTEEMTHRVVKFGARSPESREALRFSKRHPNSKLLKIARFKIGELERFDVENGLASPWVRVLHFLDEEVFDRLRLGSIGQVATVTGFVLAILFLSDRTRSWFGGPARTPPATVISDNALIAMANQSPSPFDEWLNKELVKALESPQVRQSLTKSLSQSPAAPTIPVALSGPSLVIALKAAFEQDVSFKLPLAGGTDEELTQQLQATLGSSDLSTDQKARIQQWLDTAEDRAALLQLWKAERDSASAQAKARSALAAWLESPAARAAFETKRTPASEPTSPPDPLEK